jgi:hypothetical protein
MFLDGKGFCKIKWFVLKTVPNMERRDKDKPACNTSTPACNIRTLCGKRQLGEIQEVTTCP